MSTLARTKDAIQSFDAEAIEIFHFQYRYNELYHNYVNALRRSPDLIKAITDIPFLPVSFFKTHIVLSGHYEPKFVFESSGTTGENTSRHYVPDIELYERTLLSGFQQFYGAPSGYVILALLPSYLERKNASLVHMADLLIRQSGREESGFYLNEFGKLAATIQELESRGQKTLLLGVTFALLDFAAAYPMQLQHTIVMETGGMKGRREEWTRSQVHSFLKQQWGLPVVHSEYGMTELLSQGYAVSHGVFRPIDSMRVLVRDINDPLEVTTNGTGCLNIIDLANRYSCSFIATEDLGRVFQDGSFEVLGRMDHAILRGCSMLAV
jgi:hypothetical protein